MSYYSNANGTGSGSGSAYTTNNIPSGEYNPNAQAPPIGSAILVGVVIGAAVLMPFISIPAMFVVGLWWAASK